MLAIEAPLTAFQQGQVHKLMADLGWLPPRAALPGASELARFAPECEDGSFGAKRGALRG